MRVKCSWMFYKMGENSANNKLTMLIFIIVTTIILGLGIEMLEISVILLIFYIDSHK